MAIRLRHSVLVMAHVCLVYASGATSAVHGQSNNPSNSPSTPPVSAKKSQPQPSAGSVTPKAPVTNETLPSAAQDMREALLTAAHSGRIEDLRTPIEWNEIKPYSGATGPADPIAHWRTQSRDGEGRDVLAALIAILGTTPATTANGKDLENNRIFVWPGFADADLKAISSTSIEELGSLTTEATAKAMIERGRYSGWRIAIGADGVWHSLEKIPE
jgi:hypothetical protein